MNRLKLELSENERESIIREKIIPKKEESISNIYTDLNIFNNIYDSTNTLISNSLFDNIPSIIFSILNPCVWNSRS